MHVFLNDNGQYVRILMEIYQSSCDVADKGGHLTVGTYGDEREVGIMVWSLHTRSQSPNSNVASAR